MLFRPLLCIVALLTLTLNCSHALAQNDQTFNCEWNGVKVENLSLTEKQSVEKLGGKCETESIQISYEQLLECEWLSEKTVQNLLELSIIAMYPQEYNEYIDSKFEFSFYQYYTDKIALDIYTDDEFFRENFTLSDFQEFLNFVFLPKKYENIDDYIEGKLYKNKVMIALMMVMLLDDTGSYFENTIFKESSHLADEFVLSILEYLFYDADVDNEQEMRQYLDRVWDGYVNWQTLAELQLLLTIFWHSSILNTNLSQLFAPICDKPQSQAKIINSRIRSVFVLNAQRAEPVAYKTPSFQAFPIKDLQGRPCSDGNATIVGSIYDVRFEIDDSYGRCVSEDGFSSKMLGEGGTFNRYGDVGCSVISSLNGDLIPKPAFKARIDTYVGEGISNAIPVVYNKTVEFAEQFDVFGELLEDRLAKDMDVELKKHFQTMPESKTAWAKFADKEWDEFPRDIEKLVEADYADTIIAARYADYMDNIATPFLVDLADARIEIDEVLRSLRQAEGDGDIIQVTGEVGCFSNDRKRYLKIENTDLIEFSN